AYIKNQVIELMTGRNLELEKSLAPRLLPDISDHEPRFHTLRSYAGIIAVLYVVSDGEARRAARQIVNWLQAAGWKVIGPRVTPEEVEPINDGVLVLWPSGQGKVPDTMPTHQ